MKLNFINVTDVRDSERTTGQRCDFKHVHSTLILRVILFTIYSPVIQKKCSDCSCLFRIIQDAFCNWWNTGDFYLLAHLKLHVHLYRSFLFKYKSCSVGLGDCHRWHFQLRKSIWETLKRHNFTNKTFKDWNSKIYTDITSAISFPNSWCTQRKISACSCFTPVNLNTRAWLHRLKHFLVITSINRLDQP